MKWAIGPSSFSGETEFNHKISHGLVEKHPLGLENDLIRTLFKIHLKTCWFTECVM